jgi:hypothetical protein
MAQGRQPNVDLDAVRHLQALGMPLRQIADRRWKCPHPPSAAHLVLPASRGEPHA